MRGRSLPLASIVAFGYALLYIPIVSVVIYSFNDSRLVTLWGGFSLRWYASLLHDDKLLSAAFLSLRIAVVSATFATALGAIVALALAPRHAPARPVAAVRHGDGAARDARDHHRAVAALPLHLDGEPDRLADEPRRGDDHDCPHHVLDGLRRRRRPLAAGVDGRHARGGRDGPRRPTAWPYSST